MNLNKCKICMKLKVWPKFDKRDYFDIRCRSTQVFIAFVFQTLLKQNCFDLLKMMKTLNPRTDPRECLFRLGNNIRKLINKALDQNCDDNNDIKEAIDCLQNAVQTEDNNKQLIDYETLSSIHKYLQRIDANYNLYFYQLLDECRVVLPQTRKVFI